MSCADLALQPPTSLYPLVIQPRKLVSQDSNSTNGDRARGKCTWSGFGTLRTYGHHQLIVLGYTSVVHQRGPDATLAWLRNQRDSVRSVLWLMPCHTTPWSTHLHSLLVPPRQVCRRFLDCSPPLETLRSGATPELDEADRFFAHPVEFLRQDRDLSSASPLPSHVIAYGDVAEVVLSSYFHRWGIVSSQVVGGVGVG